MGALPHPAAAYAEAGGWRGGGRRGGSRGGRGGKDEVVRGCEGVSFSGLLD